ncbi:MAG: class I SAM-dependent RNA methyltransferase [Eubacteriales bacterium]|nr:class I SAM-dependent RNA methyltransferase [Eubacteriales bacterium]
MLEGIVTRVDYPGKGIVQTQEGPCAVKNVLPGQHVRLRVTKKRHGKAEGTLQEVLEKSPVERTAPCPHFGACGGCVYLNLPEEQEAALKCGQVRRLLEESMQRAAQLSGIGTEEHDSVLAPENWFEGILSSPRTSEYRNKMEYTFGDAWKDGPLALGMHKRGGFYDIVTVDGCRLTDPDFSLILRTVLEYFRKTPEVPFYHRLRHTGYLRHLLVRRAAFTGEILVDLVTTTQLRLDLSGLVEKLVSLHQPEQDLSAGAEKAAGTEESDGRNESIGVNKSDGKNESTGINESAVAKQSAAPRLRGKIVGILHTSNDSLADVIADQGTEILYGTDHFTEELLGLRFTVTPFSFFQTNSYGAEVLYETARQFLTERSSRCGIVYDLYCGTGTIAQLMAPYADKVIGVEIVEEAVEAARENAERNGLSNCEFIAGDVLKVLDGIEEKPDTIILDPPRDGIHPKALPRIIAYGVENILYISCKPTSLARDLPAFIAAGYRPVRGVCVNQFPWTSSVETVCLLSKTV